MQPPRLECTKSPSRKPKMNTLVACSLLAVVIVACQADTTTHKPHVTHVHHSHAPHTGSTHEPNVAENFSFFYSYVTHKIIIHKGHNCYVATLTADELAKVHTDAGLRDIEIRLLGQLASATATTADMLGKDEVKHCGAHITHYYTI